MNSNLLCCCHLTSPTCLIPAYSSSISSGVPHIHTHTHTHTHHHHHHLIALSPRHTWTSTHRFTRSHCAEFLLLLAHRHIHTHKHTGHFTGCLFLPFTHTHTHSYIHAHYLLPSPHLSQIFFLSLQLISLASLALPSPRCRPSPLCLAVSSCTITNAHNAFALIPRQSS